MTRKLTTQVIRQTPQLEAFVGLLRAHAATTKRLSAELIERHALTLNDYEVLLHLARAPARQLRRVDLAERALLTPSGITRLLEGLERAGYVTRSDCPSDRRVTYAELTDAGYEKLRQASRTHVKGIEALFADSFGNEDLRSLASLLGRLADGGVDEPCEP